MRDTAGADVEALHQTASLLDGRALEAAVSALGEASTIEVYGVGSSAPIAMDAYFRFRRIGLPVSLVLDPHMQAVSASRLDARGVAFVVSHSGRTPETLEAASHAWGRRHRDRADVGGRHAPHGSQWRRAPVRHRRERARRRSDHVCLSLRLPEAGRAAATNAIIAERRRT
ncbi:hypothetical protein BH23DEI1_BH23DEI1_20840 [soil metagenome]